MIRSETYATPGPLRLDLDVPWGEVQIDTSDRQETHIELEALSQSERVRELVASARIELVRRGEGHEVVVSVRGRHGGFWISFGDDGGPDISLRIACPHGADLDVRTKSADVEARGEYGSVEVNTASGDIEVQETRGELRVKTASGDVHVERVGSTLDVNSVSGDVHVGVVQDDVRAQLVSGDIFVSDVGGSISANTVSGDQRFEAVERGRVELKAISGEVNVGIRRGSRLYIDANTVSGSTSSEMELSDAPAAEPAEDAPLVELFVKTVSGDIRIERAPARHTAEVTEGS